MTENPLRWYEHLFVGMQYLLPHHLLSALMFRITRIRWRPLKDLVIRNVVRHYRVDMAEALQSDPAAYRSFNEFFTRTLRPGARPLAEQEDAVVCPADGALSQLGTITDGRILQAKGRDYSLLELLGGRADWAERLNGGTFATIYLSPRDYHRVHMPLEGRLREMIHVPGRLFSVNPVTTSLVPRLFGRNERVLCMFEGEVGPMAVILVGAIFVGSMETVWAGQVTPTGGDDPSDVLRRRGGDPAGERRGDGEIQHGLHRHPGVSSASRRLGSGVETRRRRAHGTGNRASNQSNPRLIRIHRNLDTAGYWLPMGRGQTISAPSRRLATSLLMLLPTHPILRIREQDLDAWIRLRVAARLGINSARFLFSVRRAEIYDHRIMLARTKCTARTAVGKSVALRLMAFQ